MKMSLDSFMEARRKDIEALEKKFKRFPKNDCMHSYIEGARLILDIYDQQKKCLICREKIPVEAWYKNDKYKGTRMSTFCPAHKDDVLDSIIKDKEREKLWSL